MLKFTENIIAQMTRECNLRCKFCYESPKKEWKGKYIDFESFKKIIDTIIYQRCILGTIENKINWHFHGGEFLLIPFEDFKKDIEYLEERKKFFPGLNWCSQSNGLLLNEEIAKYFVEHNLSFGFSFDGYFIEDRMPLDKNIELIEKFRDYHNRFGLHCSFIMVIKKENLKTWYNDALSCKDFCDSVGVNILCDLSDDNIPTFEEQWTFIYEPILNSMLTSNPLMERNTLAMLSFALQSLLFNSENKEKTGCFSRLCAFGSNMISVDPNLEMHGCDKHLDRGPYANLIKNKSIFSLDFCGYQTVNEVLQHLNKIAKLEKQLGCDKCPAKDLCPGECQAYNISRFGEDRLSKEGCILYNKIFDFIEEHWTTILQKVPILLNAEPTEITAYARKKLKNTNLKLCIEKDKFYLKKLEE